MNQNFHYVDAVYREEVNPDYAGNPFVEALPSLPESTDLVKALANLPRIDFETERQFSVAARIQRLDTLQRIVVPLPRLVELARDVIRAMVTGYGPRKPYSKSENEIIKARYQRQQRGEFISAGLPLAGTHRSLALIGSSGCGKTFALEQISKLFPPVIHHPELGRWQIPMMTIDMPYKEDSVHTLADNIFRQLEERLPDGRYGDKQVTSKHSGAEIRLGNALEVAFHHGVGVIAVDESQSGFSSKSNLNGRPTSSKTASKQTTESALTKLLISACNVGKVPLLFSGTLEMASAERFTKERRCVGHGTSHWLPLQYSTNGNMLGEFEILCRGLFKYQWMRKPIELTPEWVALLFQHTQGIPDILVKLFESCQVKAIADGLETITPELMDAVRAKEFKSTETGIEALKTRDPVLIAAVTDLIDSPDSLSSRAQARREGGQPSKARNQPKPDMPSPAAAPVSKATVAAADLRPGNQAQAEVNAVDQSNWKATFPN